MEISTRPLGDATEVIVSGRLDAYWAEPLANALEEVVRNGAHRIQLNLAGVSYISSVGIRVLIKLYKQLQRINGSLIVSHPSEAVESVLELAGLQVLLAQAPAVRAEESGAARQVEAAGIALEVFESGTAAALTCQAVGRPERLLQEGYGTGDCQRLRFGPSAFGVGLGAFGNAFDDCRERFGEFLAAGGAATYLPTDGSNAPDYLIATHAFVPELQVLYGLVCEGRFAAMARFDRAADGEPIGLSQLARAALALSGAERAGLVALAESSGLLGATLRRSPASERPAAGFFQHPEVRDWLSFSPERSHLRSLALVVGVAAREPGGELARFLRPLGGGVHGHFHAAAFSYRPLPKGLIELQPTIANLFEAETLQRVLHLIGDDRQADGGGESALMRGACWLGPIGDVTVR
ncbi:MAG: STAS domain-containing protein [Candidatus Binatia bacterium]